MNLQLPSKYRSDKGTLDGSNLQILLSPILRGVLRITAQRISIANTEVAPVKELLVVDGIPYDRDVFLADLLDDVVRLEVHILFVLLGLLFVDDLDPSDVAKENHGIVELTEN